MKKDGVLRLYFGESNLPTPEYIKAAAIRALEEGYTFYTENAGLPGMREDLAAHYERAQKVGLGPCYAAEWRILEEGMERLSRFLWRGIDENEITIETS
jgi:hypothetical protein